MIEKLRKKYDKISISNIEKKADKLNDTTAKFHYDRVCLLYYLERTSRYKENKLYKNEQFEIYLFDRHSMRIGTFNSDRLAIFNNLKEVQKHGIGLVKKVYHSCGVTNAAIVFTQLNDPKVKTRTDKQKIIEKYMKPKTKPLGPTKSQLQAEIIKKDQVIFEQQITINELTERIRKLVITVKSYKEREAQFIDA